MKRWLKRKMEKWRIKISRKLGNHPQLIFCIGKNKTGTTSLNYALKLMGYKISKQKESESFLDSWIDRNFDPLIALVKSGDHEIFQDRPFSLPDTYRAMSEAFPEAKFILSVRPDAETWVTSFRRSQSRIFGEGNIPTAAQLKAATYRRKGWIYDVIKHTYGTHDDDLYHPETLMRQYEEYNQNVISFFADQPDRFLVIDVSNPETPKQLARFLNHPLPLRKMPWLNNSKLYKAIK